MGLLRLAAVLVLGSACSSVQQQTVELIEPVFRIHPIQIFEAPAVLLPQVTLLINVEVMNPSGETLILNRMELSSVGPAQYDIAPVWQELKERIAPGQSKLVVIRAAADVIETIGGPSAPLTIRGIAYFRGDADEFRKMFVQRVPTSTRQPPREQ